MNLDPYLDQYTEIDLNWIIDLKVKTLKLFDILET